MTSDEQPLNDRKVFRLERGSSSGLGLVLETAGVVLRAQEPAFELPAPEISAKPTPMRFPPRHIPTNPSPINALPNITILLGGHLIGACL